MNQFTSTITSPIIGKLKTIYSHYSHLPMGAIRHVHEQTLSATYQSEQECLDHTQRLLSKADQLNQKILALKAGRPNTTREAVLAAATVPTLESSTEAVTSKSVANTSDDKKTCSEKVQAQSPTSASKKESASTTRSKPEACDEYFTATNDFLLSASHEDALAKLKSLVCEFQESRVYAAIRSRYLQLSIELNLYKRLAPCARPNPAIASGEKFGSQFHMETQIDQLLIDTHWLHTTHADVEVCEGYERFAPLVNSQNDFPMELANEFARLNIGNDFRALGVFVITEFLQYQLIKMQTDSVKNKIASFSKRRSTADNRRLAAMTKILEQELKQWKLEDPRVSDQLPCYSALWKAHAMLGAGCSTKLLAQLTALLSGEAQRSNKTISEKLKKLQARTDPSLWC